MYTKLHFKIDLYTNIFYNSHRRGLFAGNAGNAGNTGTFEKHVFHLCWKNETYLDYKVTPADYFAIIIYTVTSLVLLMSAFFEEIFKSSLFSFG